ncbi:hypothetical protein [Streptomyces jumonjinensis]|uniref:hypothetical protein n=1 Tax=Streptomyces jumonjinensis TaxID=1945 RepID=UPI001294E4F2|nr:hypothetical protein [Streptomyces jumonjinensis]
MAMVEALKMAPNIRVISVSEVYERRDEPGRIGVYVKVEVDSDPSADPCEEAE